MHQNAGVPTPESKLQCQQRQARLLLLRLGDSIWLAKLEVTSIYQPVALPFKVAIVGSPEG